MTRPLIEINATVHIHVGDAAALTTIINNTEDIMSKINELTAAVADVDNAADAIEALLAQLADRLEGATSDAEIAEVVDDLRNRAGEIRAAVLANTPAAPTEPTTPNPEPEPTPDAGGVGVEDPVPTDPALEPVDPADQTPAEVPVDGDPVATPDAPSEGDATPEV